MLSQQPHTTFHPPSPRTLLTSELPSVPPLQHWIHPHSHFACGYCSPKLTKCENPSFTGALRTSPRDTPVSEELAGEQCCPREGGACPLTLLKAHGSVLPPRQPTWFLRLEPGAHCASDHGPLWALGPPAALRLSSSTRSTGLAEAQSPAHPRLLSSNLAVFGFCCRKRARQPAPVSAGNSPVSGPARPNPVPLGVTHTQEAEPP